MITATNVKSQAVTQLKADMFDLPQTKKFKIDFLTPDEVNNFLINIGFERTDFDSNGWQWDYWFNYKDKETGLKVMLEGSGYYGGMRLLLIDEEEE